MATQIHTIVRNPQYLDFKVGARAVENEMSPPAPVSPDMQDPEPRHDVVASLGPEDLGAGREFPNSQEKRLAVGASAGGAEPVRRPLQNASEIALGRSTEPRAPAPGTHALHYRPLCLVIAVSLTSTKWCSSSSNETNDL